MPVATIQQHNTDKHCSGFVGASNGPPPYSGYGSANASTTGSGGGGTTTSGKKGALSTSQELGPGSRKTDVILADIRAAVRDRAEFRDNPLLKKRGAVQPWRNPW